MSEVLVNERALDAKGLWKTAYRLQRRNQSASVERIFGRLLRARVEYLRKQGTLVVIRKAT